MKHLISTLLIIFLFIGCGGGGGGGSNDDNDDSSSEPIMLISSNEAIPGSFITIEDESIKADEELDVTFENKSGYEVTIKTILTKDGSAKVPVPPIVNLSTGDFASSKATVSIPSGGEATLNILPLPAVPGVTGDVVKMYLSYTKSNLETSLDNMDEVSLEFDYDTSELVQQIQTQIDSIEAIINEIETSSQMSIYSFYDGKVILDQDDLGRLDQLLFAVLKGAMEEDLKENTIASVNILTAGSPELTTEQMGIWLRMKSNIKNSSTILLGGVSMVVTVGGCIIAGVPAGTTILFTSLAAGASILVVGTASEGMAAFEAFFDPNKEYEFGNEIVKEIKAAMLNIAVAAGGAKSGVINLISFLYTTSEVKTALQNQICNSDPVPSCKDWETKNQPAKLAINLLKFEFGKVMAPGVEGGLQFYLAGDRNAGKVEVTIHWGDGEGIVEDLKPGQSYNGFITNRGDFQELLYPFMNHAYALGAKDSGFYTIKVSAIDSNGNKAQAECKVLVTENLKPSVAFSKIPSRIKTDTTSAWGVTVAGGMAPYTYTISWLDDTEYGILDTAGDWTFNHKYNLKGIYTVSIEVTDANDISVSTTSQADVRDPVSIVSITGPTSLDVEEIGTWTVMLDGGWGPYVGSTMWMDFTETPFNSQNRQFTISHAYKEKETYTFEVDVTDDEGDTAANEFTVKVPKTDPVIPITWTITCNDPNVAPQTANTTLTINEDYTMITLDIDTAKLSSPTTTLTGNNFIFTWTEYFSDGEFWTEIFKGSIHINETTGVITASGTYHASGNVVDLICTGTWTSY